MVKLENITVVPAEVIEMCAEELSHDKNNNFIVLLETHKQLKDAGLTPIFLTEDMSIVYVSTHERLKKQLH